MYVMVIYMVGHVKDIICGIGSLRFQICWLCREMVGKIYDLQTIWISKSFQIEI